MCHLQREIRVERVELTGDELSQLIARLADAAAHISLLRLWWDGGLKYKIDDGCWSPPVGVLRSDEY
jgi:hypothetical protein